MKRRSCLTAKNGPITITTLTTINAVTCINTTHTTNTISARGQRPKTYRFADVTSTADITRIYSPTLLHRRRRHHHSRHQLYDNPNRESGEHVLSLSNTAEVGKPNTSVRTLPITPDGFPNGDGSASSEERLARAASNLLFPSCVRGPESLVRVGFTVVFTSASPFFPLSMKTSSRWGTKHMDFYATTHARKGGKSLARAGCTLFAGRAYRPPAPNEEKLRAVETHHGWMGSSHSSSHWKVAQKTDLPNNACNVKLTRKISITYEWAISKDTTAKLLFHHNEKAHKFYVSCPQKTYTHIRNVSSVCT